MPTKKMKYVTLQEGTDYRKIAQIMTQAGFQMNHATARNVLMHALGRLVKHVSGSIGTFLTEEQVEVILHDQKTHEALSDVLFEAYHELNSKESDHAEPQQ